MTVDDISRKHVSRVGIRVTKKVGKTHGWERVIITKRAFIKLDHGLDGVCLIDCELVIANDEAIEYSKVNHHLDRKRVELRYSRACASAGKR